MTANVPSADDDLNRTMLVRPSPQNVDKPDSAEALEAGARRRAEELEEIRSRHRDLLKSRTDIPTPSPEMNTRTIITSFDSAVGPNDVLTAEGIRRLREEMRRESPSK